MAEAVKLMQKMCFREREENKKQSVTKQKTRQELISSWLLLGENREVKGGKTDAALALSLLDW